MDLNKSVQVKNVFVAEAIAKSGVATSSVIDVSKTGGTATVQIVLTGSGTVKVEWTGSNNDSTYVTPSGVSEIATGLTVGTYIYSFTILAVKTMKIVVTETGTSDPVAATVTLAVR